MIELKHPWTFLKCLFKLDLTVNVALHSCVLNEHLYNNRLFCGKCDNKWDFNDAFLQNDLRHLRQINGFCWDPSLWIYLICFLNVDGSQMIYHKIDIFRSISEWFLNGILNYDDHQNPLNIHYMNKYTVLNDISCAYLISINDKTIHYIHYNHIDTHF